ncbi:Ig-like domain-containing protein [Rhodococcus sp. WMMA185]|uniref:Ig-like domain-containing protein n=1 Tax=Rhodococcus sp. WMMA185 TaxID=679318 RepID=UPI000A5E58DE|nr:Ig-like domain-containing protein [Rhodococcus sp. WMMA185]
MSGRNIRRAAGAFSAVVVAAGFAFTVGAGVAAADSQSKSWTDGKSKFTRTISNVNPHAGDTITVTTKFERKVGGVLEYIHEVNDVHPECLTLESVKVDGKSPNSNLVSEGTDYVKVRGGNSTWVVHPIISPKSHKFEFTYKVGANCDRGAALKTGMRYSGSLGSGTYNTKGPAITVGLSNSTTALDAVPADVQIGQAVPLNATVSGGATGDTVEFYDGATKIGTATLNAKGGAAFDWTPDTEGTHTLSAKYVATARVAGSQSSVLTVQVSPVPDAETTTVLTGSSSAQTGVEVSFEAQVSPAPEGGTVQFKDGDIDLGGPVAVSENGTASITHTFDAEGTYDITAVYSGAPGYSGSTAETVTVTVTDVVDGGPGDGGPGDGGPGDGGGNTDDGGTGSLGNTFGS